ncbi:hypothetical protein [Chryseolinea soli]|uniref:PKD domain-containing protein n=1 Tax=Chryseolinea soli TaxID=2321403 RepID=A0A385SV01_9BACT|nr:hypothetical protein [Chryseolinea soli]AYB32618.1 hypothetical protein D4L85_19445 [Chryseolinea soli]
MKKCLLWMALLVVGATLQTCKNDTDPVGLQNVQFSFGLRPQPSGGRTETAEPSALLISLENSAGDPVFTHKRINLLHVGTSVMTEPIQLPTGTYNITEFLLVDDAGSVLYATPKVGSPLASAVTHPLPYAFTVSADDATTVAMEVVDVSQSTPEDFGYATFDINLVNTLQVAVFINTGGELVLTTASAILDHGDEVIANYSLEAKTNLLPFAGDTHASYRLIVIKEGFKTYVKDFIYSELLASLHGAPLQIVLHQFTILVNTADGVTSDFRMSVEGGSSFHVDWGDGTSSENSFEHSYTTLGRFEIKITGDVESITSIRLAYDQPNIEAIDVQALTNLNEFWAVLTPGPSSIDLSQNTQLTSVAFAGDRKLHHVSLPLANMISYMDIQGPGDLSTAEVDDIIQKIHDSVTLWNTRNGRFLLDKNWASPTNGMVGPPSPSSVEMLRDLKENYGWQVLPDPGA